MKQLPAELPSGTTSLYMDGNDLYNINWTMFSLPSYARLLRLGLSDSNISSVSGEWLKNLKNLEYLNLRKNKIESLDNWFSEMSQLKVLHLSQNFICCISKHAFVGLRNLKFLHLQSNEIRHLEPYIFRQLSALQNLYLSYNRLTQLLNNAFTGLKSLTQLYIQNNEIHSIESKSFHGLWNLHKLFLDNNKITSINGDAFSGLKGLTYLRLGGNMLSTSRPMIMSLPRLQTLSLNNCSLTSDDVETILRGVSTSLLQLDLSFNKLDIVRKTSFPVLYSLYTLDLKHNQISSIFVSSMSQFPRLKFLDLSNNKLKGLRQRTFEGLKSLERLILFNNALVSIDEDAFMGLRNLIELHLDCNRLVSLNETILRGLDQIKMIYLRSNQISSIDENTWRDVPTLKYLYLDANTLQCSCQLFHDLLSVHERRIRFDCRLSEQPDNGEQWFERSSSRNFTLGWKLVDGLCRGAFANVATIRWKSPQKIQCAQAGENIDEAVDDVVAGFISFELKQTGSISLEEKPPTKEGISTPVSDYVKVSSNIVKEILTDVRIIAIRVSGLMMMCSVACIWWLMCTGRIGRIILNF